MTESWHLRFENRRWGSWLHWNLRGVPNIGGGRTFHLGRFTIWSVRA